MIIHNKYLLLGICLFLAACSKTDFNDLQQFVEKEKSYKAGKIKALPDFIQYKMFAYDALEGRDPFVPVVDVEIVTKLEYSGPRPDENRIKEPLEYFSLDSLRMMGSLKQNETTWILIKDPEGLLHRLTIGNYLGLNNGKIINLYEDSVEIIELIVDGKGWRKRKTGLAMSGD